MKHLRVFHSVFQLDPSLFAWLFLHRTPLPRKGIEIKHEPLRAGSCFSVYVNFGMEKVLKKEIDLGGESGKG